MGPRPRPAGFCALLAALVAAISLTAQARGGEPAWPGSREGLVLAWRCANRPAEVIDPATGTSRIFRVEPRGTARFGRFFEMDPRGGFFAGEGAEAAIVAACKKTHQLTLEALVAPSDLQQGGPAAILSLASPQGAPKLSGKATLSGVACPACLSLGMFLPSPEACPRNGGVGMPALPETSGAPSPQACDLLLGQERDRLVLRLGTSSAAAGGGALIDLGPLEAGRPQHVLITYQLGRLACYRDGEAVALAAPVTGDFSTWSAATLTFGGGPGGEKPWKGRLEGIAVYNRFLEPAEAKARFGLAAARVKGRPPAERVTVEARLAAMTPTPDPKSVAPYVRVLVAGEYEVEKVVEGRCDAKRILVAHWAILDGRVLPPVASAGAPQRLVLERFDDHPELESERLIMTGVDGRLPLFLDTRR